MARVLVVDDSKDTVDTTIALLGMAGHTGIACYSGPEAMDRVREFDPDVVLLDIRMPDKDGWAVAKEIRETVPGKRPTLIAITGEHPRDGQAGRLAKAVGFDYFLAKPVDPNELLALIEKAAKRNPG